MLELNKIICGESSEILRHFPYDCIDLTVTSPPYDNLRNYNGYEFDFEAIANELFKVTKPGGVVVWVVGDATINGSETGTSFQQALYFKEIGFNLHDTMIYAKNGFSNPSSNRYHQVFEYMFVFSKNIPKTFNPIKDKKNLWETWGVNTSRQKNGELEEKKKRKSYVGELGMRYNIWNFNVGGSGMSTKDDLALNHPATFPEKLAQDHIYSWSNEGDLVLDPFCGSGTTLKMAHLQNRKFIGIDISKEYCELAEKRINPYLMQEKLIY